MNDKTAEERVIDGSSWAEFCDALKAAGQVVQSEKAPKDAFNQAEGYRYLTRLLRAGLESFLEFGDSAYPVLRCGAHETIKMGADNPDNRYESCSVNAQYDYRLSGTRGSVDYLGFGAVINKYASGGTMETTGFLDARDMDINEGGSFEIIISQREQPGNWLQMNPDTNSIKYGFILSGEDNEKLAQSPYIFNKKEEGGDAVENDIEEEIKCLIREFGYELDLYCEENPCDNNEGPYSFRATAVFPCWPMRFQDLTFRGLVERTIEKEAPAHMDIKVVWVGMAQMMRFEKVYCDWLAEMFETEIPSYEIVNPLIEVMNTLQPCGCEDCEDCEDDCNDTMTNEIF